MARLESLSGVSLDRLSSFIKVVHSGSIVDAAEGDPAKQAQYSRQMGDLERALGMKLFNRDGRQLKPTREGEVLAGIVAGFFDSMQQEMAAQHKQRTPLRMGTGDAVTRWILAPLLPGLLKNFGSCFELDIQHLTTDDIVGEVRAGKLHLGIVHEDADVAGLEKRSFQALEFAFFYPEEGPDFSDLKVMRGQKQIPLVTLSGGGHYVQRVRSMEEKLGLRWEVVTKVSSLPVVAEFADQLRASAFLPIQAQNLLPRHLVISTKLSGLARFRRNYCVIYHPRVVELQRMLAEWIKALCR